MYTSLMTQVAAYSINQRDVLMHTPFIRLFKIYDAVGTLLAGLSCRLPICTARMTLFFRCVRPQNIHGLPGLFRAIANT
jgi:hypothetical protein